MTRAYSLHELPTLFKQKGIQMLGASKDKKESAKEEKENKHIQSKVDEKGEIHHDLLPNEPTETVVDEKTQERTVEPGVPTEIQD